MDIHHIVLKDGAPEDWGLASDVLVRSAGISKGDATKLCRRGYGLILHHFQLAQAEAGAAALCAAGIAAKSIAANQLVPAPPVHSILSATPVNDMLVCQPAIGAAASVGGTRSTHVDVPGMVDRAVGGQEAASDHADVVVLGQADHRGQKAVGDDLDVVVQHELQSAFRPFDRDVLALDIGVDPGGDRNRLFSDTGHDWFLVRCAQNTVQSTSPPTLASRAS